MMSAARFAKTTVPETLGRRREAFAKLMRLADSSVRIARVDERELPGPEDPLRVRIYTPAAAVPGRSPAIIYFHGGGLVAGSLDTHDGFCRSLADATGAKLIAVAYRLAPEHCFPAAIAAGLLSGQQLPQWSGRKSRHSLADEELRLRGH